MTRNLLTLRLVLALAACAVCGVGTGLLAAGAVGTARGQRLDQLVLTAADSDRSVMTWIVYPVLDTVSVPVVAAALAIVVIVALARRRLLSAVPPVVLVVGAIATTEVLKYLVVTRTQLAADIELTPNSFPSGHTTTAGAVALALILISPRPLRSLAALVGAAWAALVGIGTVTSGWHRPSDVLGALLVVGTWTFLMLAVDAARALGHAAHPDAGDPAHAAHRAPAVQRGALPAIAVLGLAAVVGLAVGAGTLAAVPTPLDLDDVTAQATAYRATMLILAGAAAALVAAALALRVPEEPYHEVPRRGDPMRVR